MKTMNIPRYYHYSPHSVADCMEDVTLLAEKWKLEGGTGEEEETKEEAATEEEEVAEKEDAKDEL